MRHAPILAGILLTVCPAAAQAQAGGDETVEQALCRLVDASARQHALPIPFLTRLIFRESAFKVGVVSPAGAQGVAQFMPGTARERGLLDPFDPEQAIPHAASFLADLKAQFGNLGLAAAAYNGGPGRVGKWLAGEGGLPAETRAYVLAITGRPAEDWRPGGAGIEMAPDDDAKKAAPGTPPAKDTAKPPEHEAGKPVAEEPAKAPPDVNLAGQTCMQVTAALRIPRRGDKFAMAIEGAVAAPWGIQLAGNFSKSLALASFNRTRALYASVIGNVRPMIIGTRLRFRGSHAFYRIRLPAETRGAADTLCDRIRKAGGACIVLKT